MRSHPSSLPGRRDAPDAATPAGAPGAPAPDAHVPAASAPTVLTGEALVAALFTQAPLSVALYDAAGRVAAGNAAYEQHFGIRVADVPADWSLFTDPQLAAAGLTPLIRRAYAGEVVTLPPTRYDAAAATGGPGRTVWTQGHCYPVRDADAHAAAGLPGGAPGRVTHVAVLHVDVTAWAEAEAELARVNVQLRDQAAEREAVLGQLAEGVIVTDVAGRITFVNEAAARLHGVARLDVAPEAYAATYHLLTVDGRPYPSAELPLARAVLRGETVLDAPWRIVRPDGTEVLAVGSARPVRGPDGTPVGAALTMRDDTARAAADAALRQANVALAARNAALAEQGRELERANQELQENAAELEMQTEELQAATAELEGQTEEAVAARQAAEAERARAEALLEGMADAYVALDADYRMVAVNAAMERACGLPRDQLLGRDFWTVFPGGRGTDIERHYRRAVTEGVETHFTHDYRDARLDLVAEVDAYPAPSAGGAGGGVAIFWRDVTARTRAEAARAESERQFRTLADAIPTLAWTARADGYIDWYNARWYAYTGTTPDQMAGWGWQSVHDPAVLPDVVARWTASIASGDVFEMTFPLRGADGRFRRFLTRVTPVRDGDGRVVRWFGTNTDVEAERAARDAAERATARTARLQALTAALAGAHTVDDVAAVLVAEGVGATGATTGALVVRAADADDADSAVIVRQTGVTPEVMAQYGRFPLTMPGPAAYALRTGEAVFVETRDGPEGLFRRFPEVPDLWARLDTHALATVPLAVAGSVVGAMSFTFAAPRAFDADDRAFFLALGRQAAQAVERARLFDAERAAAAEAEAGRARLAFLADASAALSTSLDYEATLARAARLAVPVLADYAVVDVAAADGGIRRLAEAHRDPALDPLLAGTARYYEPGPDARHPLQAALDAGKARLVADVTDAWVRSAARTPAHLADIRTLGPRSLMLVPLRARDRVVGLLTLVASTSGRRFDDADLALADEFAHRAAVAADNARLYAAAEAARMAAEEDRAHATEANRAKSQFLANMSHELRTPLNAIGGYAQLLDLGLHGPVTDEQRGALGRVQKAQHRLLALINDILNYAKLESGRVEYDVRAVDVRDVVAEVAPLVEPQMTAKGLAFDVRLPATPCVVWADREKLGQVLVNLLSNATKFTDARHPGTGAPGRVTVHLAQRGGRVDTVFLRVSDTGRGIPRDKQEAIFDPFVQVQTGYARATEGTGLGLAISRDLARGMGGDLRVRSAEGEGATFTVALRRVAAADGTPVDRRTPEERRLEQERRAAEDRREPER